MKTCGPAQKRVLEEKLQLTLSFRHSYHSLHNTTLLVRGFLTNLGFNAPLTCSGWTYFQLALVEYPLLNAVAAESPGSIQAGVNIFRFGVALPNDGENIGQVSS